MLLSVVLSATASPLTQRDLLAPGDGLITYDPATGLEWLDVLATGGMSYNQVRASEFRTSYHFSHATADQVAILAGDAIPSAPPFPSDTSRTFDSKTDMLADPWAQDVLELYRLFSGDPDPELGYLTYIYGVTADPFTPLYDGSRQTEALRFGLDHSMADDPYDLSFGHKHSILAEAPDDQPFSGGHFLVRTLPEPEQAQTLWLLFPVTGLLFLSRARATPAQPVQA